ncbi:hypothetical protein EDEG_03493 [Edhazardia aedis USNM 41457]|uniref:DNA replication factor RFC1 C-terminal domain-containing protein n=1 Tax=Edhazardia aedis (strain USNM 41457) TaxID=1003232 RepID=J9D3F2_EDHAE|nr:hypothetical protein EDEG_03493 [Edhazardia aedis USNM 41457]|eukprot:EJW02069.1 hypothetical protein EDEG_03493 [Edhazardia aedis USNM 41457]
MRSKKLKNIRNLCVFLLHAHNALRMNKYQFTMNGLDLWLKRYCRYLDKGQPEKSLQFLVEHELLKSDVDNIVEIAPDIAELFKSIPSKNKRAFTTQYKKLKRQLPYIVDEATKPSKATDDRDKNNDDDNDEDEEIDVDM